ncbi:uncharacterized protein LOC127277824 [Leptopilina boulardi]|uniref:uncharacterized protein LOC127277824 n=1 Tax=Leptopilina boulardi TaxID=63433 RepID=UPI0021F59BF1|nr:uncharacterized protein LOC127277824 [Leptopilina boulardi]
MEERNMHLEQNAIVNPNGRFICDFRDSNASYDNKSSLRSHKSRKHRMRVPLQNVEINVIEEANNLMDVDYLNNIENLQADNLNDNNDNRRGNDVVENQTSDSATDDSDEVNSDEDETEETEQPEREVDPRKRAMGLLLLQLRSTTSISEEKIDLILQTIQNAAKEFVAFSLRQLEEIIEENTNIHVGQFYNIEQHIRNINFTDDFNSKKKRTKFFNREFNVLMPKKRILGSRFIKYGSAKTNEERSTKVKYDEMYFIPLSKILKKFCEQPSYPDIVDNHTSKEGVLASIQDGLKFKEEIWRQDNSHHNILLSKSSGNQKLWMIYASTLQIHPIYRSALLHIYLVAIVRTTYVKRYGLNSIMKHIVNDLKKIESVIHYLNGTIIRGSLFATQGDNLAQHSMCGFKESFGRTRHPCRYCLADLAMIHQMVEENRSLLRNQEEHDRQVEMIENAYGQEREKLMTDYGIKRKSVLNKLNYYHVIKVSPPDLVHDLLLGVIPRTIQFFLQQVILNQISVEELNERLASFDFGYSEVDKRPPPLKAVHLFQGANLKLSAVELWTLAHILPFVVQDLVEPDCRYYKNYTDLLQISCIVFGYEISQLMIDFLEDLIAEYLSDFIELYETTLIPKQHFLIHYPRLIMFYGPLGIFMCLRPETNHQVFKRITQAMRNYKNLPLTLSVRYEQRQAFELLTPLSKEIEFGPQKLSINMDLPYSHLYEEGLLLCTTSWINFNGVKYIPGKCLVAVGYSDNSNPLFASLEYILRCNDGPAFICRTVKTIEHNVKLMAYEVSVQEEYKIYRLDDLKNHEVFHCHMFDKKSFVIVKRCFGNLH